MTVTPSWIRHPATTYKAGLGLSRTDWERSSGHELDYAITRGVTYKIAANDAMAAEKAQADAVCNDVSDEEEINAGIAAVIAAGGGTVQLSSGVFHPVLDIDLTTQTNCNITLEGAGKDATMISWWGGPAGKILNIDHEGGAQRRLITIRDLSIASYATPCAYGIYVDSANGLQIHSVDTWTQVGGGMDVGFYCTLSNFVSVRDCRFRANTYAARLVDNAYIDFGGICTFATPSGKSLSLEGYANAFSMSNGNFQSDNGDGIGLYCDLHDWHSSCHDFGVVSFEHLSVGAQIVRGKVFNFRNVYGEDVSDRYFILGEYPSITNIVHGFSLDGAMLKADAAGQDVAIDVVNADGVNIQGVDCGSTAADDIYAISWLRVGANCEVNLGPSSVYNSLYRQNLPIINEGGKVTGYGVPDLYGDVIEQSLFAATSQTDVFGDSWKAKIFTATYNMVLTGVTLHMNVCGATGTPGDVTVSITAEAAGIPDGADLAVGTTDGDTLFSNNGVPHTERRIRFTTPLALTAATKYAIVIRALTGDVNSYIRMWLHNYADAVDYGVCWSTNAGVNWNHATYHGYDMPFELWGYVT